MLKPGRDIEQEESLIFLHIPKTGGSTLHGIIERQYEPNPIFTIDGNRFRESIDEFKRLPEEQRRKIKVLKGHMYFGLHEFLPGHSTYITILRDPIERVVSLYHYILRNPDHRAHEAITSQHMSLKDFVICGEYKLLNNGQTRILCGEPKLDADVPFGQCPAKMLELAKRNLQEHFRFVGLLERFDESLILLKKTFGWKLPFYKPRNITRERPPKKAVSKDALHAIEKYNGLDIELYRYAKGMFEELISSQSPSFEREVRSYRLLNKFVVKIYPYCGPPVKKIKAVVRRYI